jgi:hypothetical protein
MPTYTCLTRPLVATALAVMLVAAPTSMKFDMSGKMQLVGAMAMAQAVPDPIDPPPGGPIDPPPGGPIDPPPGCTVDCGPIDPPPVCTVDCGPIDPPPPVVKPPVKVEQSAADRAQDTTTPASVPATLTPDQQSVRAFAESVQCGVTCKRTVSSDGTLTIFIEGDSGTVTITFKGNAVTFARETGETDTTVLKSREEAERFVQRMATFFKTGLQAV